MKFLRQNSHKWVQESLFSAEKKFRFIVSRCDPASLEPGRAAAGKEEPRAKQLAGEALSGNIFIPFLALQSPGPIFGIFGPETSEKSSYRNNCSL